ncbi:MAG: hypothetical protein DRP00_05460 [Candidatus Aenigmatarchaeota archaeon]|nr:MAG: hypothetical protein DRP00_05460 [Candidatus Aenigmarchaeota archaeon]
MPRKPDPEKIHKIIRALADNPQGLWVREIARVTGLDKSTVSIYLSRHLKDQIEQSFSVGGLVKVVRLKKR